MGRAKTSTWVTGAVFVALMVLALGWFLAISPQLDRASQAREETEAARQQNVVQTQRLATLRQQYEEIDSYKAELAAIHQQIPTTGQMPALVREVNAAAQRSSVTVLSVLPGTPETFFAAAPSQPTVQPEASDAGDAESEASDDAPAPVAGGAPGVDGMVAVPVQVTVLGSYDAARTFVAELQTGIDRLFVVTTFDVTGQDEAEASGGRPATQEGDAELVVHGYIYVLQDTRAATPEAAPADASVDL